VPSADLVVLPATSAIAEVARGATPSSTPPVDLYLAGIRPASRRTVVLRLRQVLTAVGAPAVTLEHVRAFPWDRLEVDHVRALSSAIRERYAPSTGRGILVALRGVLRACWQAGCYPWEDFERRVDAFATIEGTRVARGRAASPREVSALFNAATYRERLGLALLFGAGLRRAEACGLRWSAFDGTALRVRGKGDRERVVPLPSWALTVLRAVRGEPDAWVLRSARGARLTTEGLYYVLRRLADRAGVQPLSPHDARRTYISELLDVADASVVAELAGHASLEQLRRYDRRGERAGRDAVARLRNLIVDESSSGPDA
jgi:integrase